MKLFIANPNVNYAGKTLPKDKAPLQVPIVDPNVNYNSKTLPQDKVTPTPFSDPNNTPGLIIIGGITLPPDARISPMDAKKQLVHTTIMDGANGEGIPVFEHIATMATRIEIEFTLRMQNIGGTLYNNTNATAGVTNNVFPQQYLHDVWYSVFKPNSVLTIQNSMLNNLGISQVVVDQLKVGTVRSNTNVPCTLYLWENVPGQSLNINP